jgi:hypothetical protein
MMNNQNNFGHEGLSMTIKKAAQSLHGAIRYIYAVGKSDFDNINVKDLFKISLSDITQPNILSNLGISPAQDLEGDSFAQLNDLIFYAFAVRVPYLRRQIPSDRKINDKLLRDLYRSCSEKGANDPDGIVQESFKSNMKAAKSSRPEPPLNGEWFRRWVYSCGGELAAITNRNMFLLGCMDALIPLYYAKLTDILAEQLT